MAESFGTGETPARARTAAPTFALARAAWTAPRASGVRLAHGSCAVSAWFVAARPSRSRHSVPTPWENRLFSTPPEAAAPESIPPTRAGPTCSGCCSVKAPDRRFRRRALLPARDRRNYRLAAPSRPATPAIWCHTTDYLPRAGASASPIDSGTGVVAPPPEVDPTHRWDQRPSHCAPD